MAMRFHDRHEWIDCLKACEVARRIVADSLMIADARIFVAMRMLPGPHQRDYALMWQELLPQTAAEIAAALTENGPRGSYSERPVRYSEMD
ncbi:MAG TPA: hypothetical protein VGG99_21760 [Acetobacteraceae bacterium]|jgi:hypothetical protein